MPEEAQFCPTCGTYQAHKPRVEMERDASTRGWRVFIVTIDHERERGMELFIPDRPEQDWRVGQPQDLLEGVRFAQ